MSEKEHRLLPERSKSEATTPFSWGLRIIDKGMWWYYCIWVAIAALYWFDFLVFLKEHIDSPDLVMLISFTYIIVLMIVPGWLVHRYKQRGA